MLNPPVSLEQWRALMAVVESCAMMSADSVMYSSEWFSLERHGVVGGQLHLTRRDLAETIDEADLKEPFD